MNKQEEEKMVICPICEAYIPLSTICDSYEIAYDLHCISSDEPLFYIDANNIAQRTIT